MTRRPALRFDRILSGALALFGLVALLLSLRIDTSTASSTDVGPAFLPRLFAGALILCALLAIVRAKPAPAAEGRVDRVVVLTMILVVAYALALPYLGYGVSSTLVLAAVLTVVRAGAWWRIAVFSLAAAAAIYLVFEKLLTVGLPAGPWGF